MDALTIQFQLTRERDHDAPRRIAEAIHEHVQSDAALAATVLVSAAPRPGAATGIDLFLHPALPPIRILPSGSGAVGSASSWPGGPGYHEAALAAIEGVARAADVELTLDDATGFARTHDRAALERALDQALAGAAREALAFSTRAGALAHIQIGLPPRGSLDELWLIGDPPGIFTVAGRRDRAFLEAASRGGAGAAFFPWRDRTLDDRGAQTLARALVDTHLTWAPARGDRQKRLREIARTGIARGEATPEVAALRTALETLGRGEAAELPSLRHLPRVGLLGGGWSAVLAGRFEVEPFEGAAPPRTEAGPVHLDATLRLESFAQPVPAEAPFPERADEVMAQAAAAGAALTADDRARGFVGFAVERKLADGGTALIGSFAGPRSHLAVRMLTLPTGNPEVARAVWSSIEPERDQSRRLVL